MGIFYIDGLCGSGKTHASIEAIRKLVANRKNVLYVSPSTELQYEFSTRLGMISHTVINYLEASSNGKSVTQTIKDRLKSPKSGQVLVITHAAFKNISDFPNKKKWTVFIDEEMEINDFMECDASAANSYAYGNDLMKDMERICTFVIHKEGFTSFHKKSLSPKDTRFLRSISFSNNNVYPPFQRFIQNLLNPNMQVFADTNTLVSFKLGFQNVEMWSEIRLELFQGFENIYFMGARIQYSKLFAYFRLKGVSFRECKIEKRFDTHAQPITIRYMVDNPSWSKTFYQQKNSKEPSYTNFELFDLLVSGSIGDEPILLQNNKSNKFRRISNPINMPYEIKGLNQYAKYNHYAEGGAYNWSPAYQSRMTALGFDCEELMLHQALSKIYQGITRTSIRNGEFHDNIVFVPTKKMAQNLRNLYFPNAKIEQIENSDLFFR
jgi:hypothetical protein